MDIAYRTMELKKWTRYDLIIEISDYCHNSSRLWTRRKSELITILIELEANLE